jgi:hypothetical protein
LELLGSWTWRPESNASHGTLVSKTVASAQVLEFILVLFVRCIHDLRQSRLLEIPSFAKGIIMLRKNIFHTLTNPIYTLKPSKKI